MSKYLTYNSEELAADPDFIRWVRYGEKGEFWELLLMENAEFRIVMDDAKSIVQRLSFIYTPLDPDVEERLWSRINESTKSSKVKTRILSFGKWVGVAAGFSILIMAVYWNMSFAKYTTKEAAHREVFLPDNSQIIINSVSTVSLNKRNFGIKREIILKGEAFFDVQTIDIPFRVVAGKSMVEVLGTTFNVYFRKDSLSVQCYSGKIAVNINDQVIHLEAGEQFGFSHKNTHQSLTPLPFQDRQPRWISGIYHFERTALKSVLEELERQFSVRVLLESSDAGSELYTGFFTADDLDLALQSVLWPMNLEYRIENNTIFIFR
ncbi:MAG TPA: FecR domain-containing protein [Saprospiraceae bacterium]|nr:FecR domain-containing protein [Saprospiraceae bacterium]